jgi:peptidoglycan hydrolase-like protein with peptidoglycan-binding domain
VARSAKPASRSKKKQQQRPTTAALVGDVVARNPVAVAATTGLVIALSYVSANALWYQPHAHPGAFFSTRDLVRRDLPVSVLPETTIRIERPETPEPAPSPRPADPRTAEVQTILQRLGFYEGAVDGLAGPATMRAIENYRRVVGLPANGGIDETLLEQLGASPKTSGIAPVREPVPAVASPMPEPERIRMIQTGLRAFGDAGISVDGIAGEKTRQGVRNFQGFFDLPPTGDPDEAVLAKMREVGLLE